MCTMLAKGKQEFEKAIDAVRAELSAAMQQRTDGRTYVRTTERQRSVIEVKTATHKQTHAHTHTHRRTQFHR